MREEGRESRVLAVALCLAGLVAGAAELKVELLPGEGWWGGATTLGTKTPFGLNATALEFDIRKENYGNQAVPLT